MMKLSKTQQEVLDKLRATKDGRLIYMQAMGRFNPNAYYFISECLFRVRVATAQKLLKNGYLKIKRTGNFGEHELYLKKKWSSGL